MTIEKGADGFYHPTSEAQLVELVQQAFNGSQQLRVRGASHSVGSAIYTDPITDSNYTVNDQPPPPGNNLNVMLDQYRGMRVVDPERRLVEVDAGINLGLNPSDPTGASKLEDSLLYQLWKNYGWTLSDLGGITHQTISGFISTGSSGGSLTYSVYDNIYKLRMIDGRGNIYEVSRDSDPDGFHATVTSMGLLGVISKVTLRCEPTFNISGQEAITTYDECSVDLFGNGSGDRPSLQKFFNEAEYTRLEWWPQRGIECMVLWQCQRMKPQPGFRPTPYEEFTNYPDAAEVVISIFFTLIGNLDDLSQVKGKLQPTFNDVAVDIDQLPIFKDMGAVGLVLAHVISLILEHEVDMAIDALTPFAPLIKEELPNILPKVIGFFIPLDSSKEGMSKGTPQSFRDYGWSGLPMDNQASDVLAPTEFTELWIPIQYSQQVMSLLKKYFDEPSDANEAYQRTGNYAFEIYGAMPNPFWMSMSYSDGKDEWKDGVIRVDVYWFVNNAGNPAEVFYPQFWKLFRDAGIPYRLHWGKFQPMAKDSQQRQDWAGFFRKQYPRWDDFLARRAQLDPKNIFLTSYWAERLGLSL